MGLLETLSSVTLSNCGICPYLTARYFAHRANAFPEEDMRLRSRQEDEAIESLQIIHILVFTHANV